jgi:hypothetical protein
MIDQSVYDAVNKAFKSGDATRYSELLRLHLNLYGDDRNEVMSNNLKHAASQNSVEMINALIQFGADVNHQSIPSRPDGPILQTCLGGSCKVEAARRLLELGAKINHEIDGQLFCHTLALAISKGNLEMVKLLVDYGAAVNGIDMGMAPLDRAIIADCPEIADYLRSIGAKTAAEQGWVPPPPPELPDIMQDYYAYRFPKEPLATIDGMLDSEPRVRIRVFDIGYEYVLHTEGMASNPIPVDPGSEDHQFVEIEMELPYEWPVGDEMLKTDENAWPVTWLRRLALHPHLSGEPIGKLFFFPNEWPPKPFASNTELSVWMVLVSEQDPIYVSDEKQIVIYKAVPLFREEYDLVQKHGIGELAKRLDENKLHAHRIFLRKKNVGLEP